VCAYVFFIVRKLKRLFTISLAFFRSKSYIIDHIISIVVVFCWQFEKESLIILSKCIFVHRLVNYKVQK